SALPSSSRACGARAIRRTSRQSVTSSAMPSTNATDGRAMKIHGGCHCGKVRYEAHIDPEKIGICHCADCQRLTGSAFSVFVPVPREHVRLTGELRVYVKTA